MTCGKLENTWGRIPVASVCDFLRFFFSLAMKLTLECFSVNTLIAEEEKVYGNISFKLKGTLNIAYPDNYVVSTV